MIGTRSSFINTGMPSLCAWSARDPVSYTHLFDNEHTTYENVKVGDADATLGTSVGENGDTVYILSWERGGVSNTIMGNISRDEIVKIAENVF